MPSARAHQRHLAVLAVLLQEGPCRADEVQAATRMTGRQTRKALWFLNAAGLIDGCWEPLPEPHVGVERQWVYYVTSAERRREYDRRMTAVRNGGDRA